MAQSVLANSGPLTTDNKTMDHGQRTTDYGRLSPQHSLLSTESALRSALSALLPAAHCQLVSLLGFPPPECLGTLGGL